MIGPPVLPLTSPPAIVAQVAQTATPNRATLLRDAGRGDLEAAASLFYLDVAARRYEEALLFGSRYLKARPKSAAFAIDYAAALLAAGKIDAARRIATAQGPYLRTHPDILVDTPHELAQALTVAQPSTAHDS